MLESDRPENMKILKKSQLRVDFRICRQTVGLSAIEADSWSWVQTMVLKNWDLKHDEMCRNLEVLLAQYDYERLLRIVFLLESKNRTQKLIINGGACGVMDIVVGNGHGDTSSNPGQDWLHFT